MRNKTISYIIDNDLCTGCGTCISICPQSAIRLKKDLDQGIYIPVLNIEKCNGCGICQKACPGPGIDFDKFNLALFGKTADDSLLGNYLNCYCGFTNNEEIRFNSTSGGLITAFLIFALEKGIINGVLVTRMKKDQPLEPEPFIARTKDAIIEASKSKYCPVPANTALDCILDSDRGDRFAIVGLPCHIHAIRKAQVINRDLREKIVLCLGLLCAHTDNFFGTELMLKKLNVNSKDVKKINYRGNGWPGSMIIELRNGEVKEIPLAEYIGTFHLYDFFTPRRCLVCSDATAELADISFGDAWNLPLARERENGHSIIITRTKKCEDILSQMRGGKEIELARLNGWDIVNSQPALIYAKKIGLGFRYELLKYIGISLPKIDGNIPRNNSFFPIDTMIPYANSYISQNKIGRKILFNAPNFLLRYYGLMCISLSYIRMLCWLNKNKINYED